MPVTPTPDPNTLPAPKSTLPKLTSNRDNVLTPQQTRELYAEVVDLRKTLNAVLTRLHSLES
jgi:hypothetical protein